MIELFILIFVDSTGLLYYWLLAYFGIMGTMIELFNIIFVGALYEYL